MHTIVVHGLCLAFAALAAAGLFALHRDRQQPADTSSRPIRLVSWWTLESSGFATQ
jgi:hypothetical protein